MSKGKLPKGSEWDSIVQNAFESEQTHLFSDNYLMHKRLLQKGDIMRKKMRDPGKRITATIMATAATLIVVPVGFGIISKTANSTPGMLVDDEEFISEDTAEITEEESTEESTEEITEEISEALCTYEWTGDYMVQLTYRPKEYKNSDGCYDLNIGYIPEGYYPDDEYNVKFHCDNGETKGGISIHRSYVDKNETMTDNLRYCVNFEEYTEDNKNVYICYRDSYTSRKDEDFVFGRETVIIFTEENYIVELYVTNDVSDDDFRNIISNLTITPTDEVIAGAWRDEEISISDTPPVEEFNIDICHIGDTVYNASFDDDVYVTIDNAWIQDNFDGLTTDGTGYNTDFSKYLSADGKIYNNFKNLILGDGENSIDEIIAEGTEEMKVVCFELTYTNKGNSEEIANFGKVIFPDLSTIKDEKTYSARVQSGADDTRNSLQDLMHEGHFSFSTSNQSSKNVIKFDESNVTTVKLAYLVSLEQLDSTYVFIDGKWGMNSENAVPAFPLSDLVK